MYVVKLWQDQWHLLTSTITMEIDPSPTQPNDELEFTELTGIDDHTLDQRLEGLGIRAMRNRAPDVKSVSEFVLMVVVQQLPAQLEYSFDRVSKLGEAANNRLLYLLDEAIQSGKYSRLRRLSMPLASLRHWNRLILYKEMLQRTPPERDQPNEPVEQDNRTCTRALLCHYLN